MAINLAYEASVRQVVHAGANAVNTVADSVGKTAAALQLQQRSIEAAISALTSLQELAGQVQDASKAQSGLLPLYATDIRNSAKAARDVGTVVADAGKRLGFSVPTTIEWENLKPRVVYTQPLKGPADALKEHAANLQRLGDTLERTADAVTSNGAKVSASVVETSKRTSTMIAEIVEVVSRVKSLDLPRSVKDMESAASSLRELSERAHDLDWFVRTALICALGIPALMFLFNGTVAIGLARRMPV